MYFWQDVSWKSFRNKQPQQGLVLLSGATPARAFKANLSCWKVELNATSVNIRIRSFIRIVWLRNVAYWSETARRPGELVWIPRRIHPGKAHCGHGGFVLHSARMNLHKVLKVCRFAWFILGPSWDMQGQQGTHTGQKASGVCSDT